MIINYKLLTRIFLWILYSFLSSRTCSSNELLAVKRKLTLAKKWFFIIWNTIFISGMRIRFSNIVGTEWRIINYNISLLGSHRLNIFIFFKSGARYIILILLFVALFYFAANLWLFEHLLLLDSIKEPFNFVFEVILIIAIFAGTEFIIPALATVASIGRWAAIV